MKIKSLIIISLLSAMLVLGGCSKQQYVNSNIQIAAYDKSNESFGYLDEQFKLNNTFTPDEVATLITSQAIILSFIEEARSESLSGGMPIAVFSVYVNECTKHYKRIKSIIDMHITKYPKATRIIYKNSVEQIESILIDANISINNAAKGEVDTEKITTGAKKLFDALGPLLK